VTAALALQVGVVARRSALRTLRQPLNIFPAVAFPLLFLFVNSGGLQSVTHLPGFPTRSFIDFFLSFSFLQGAVFATLTSGQDLATDIQHGFLNRLALTPIRGAALLAGHLAGVVALSLLQATAYLLAGFAAGASFQSGAGGVIVLILFSLLVTLAFGSIGATLALRTGATEAIQGFFPIFIVFLWFSSMYLPRNLIEQDWFRTLATINPVSYLIEAIRSLVIQGWNGEALALGFGFAAVILAFGLSAAAFSLPRRLTRT
jgi:ABC-2 type transport system permease protein